MIMMGYRTGPQDEVKTIDYVTGEDLTANGRIPVIRNRHEEEAAQTSRAAQ
jgi:hypothetical protein